MGYRPCAHDSPEELSFNITNNLHYCAGLNLTVIWVCTDTGRPFSK